MLTKLDGSELRVGMCVTVLRLLPIQREEVDDEVPGMNRGQEHLVMIAGPPGMQSMGDPRRRQYSALRGFPMRVVAADEPYVVCATDTGCSHECSCGGEARVIIDLRDVELSEITNEYVEAVNSTRHRRQSQQPSIPQVVLNENDPVARSLLQKLMGK